MVATWTRSLDNQLYKMKAGGLRPRQIARMLPGGWTETEIRERLRVLGLLAPRERAKRKPRPTVQKVRAKLTPLPSAQKPRPLPIVREPEPVVEPAAEPEPIYPEPTVKLEERASYRHFLARFSDGVDMAQVTDAEYRKGVEWLRSLGCRSVSRKRRAS